jgi:hypothetical protein
MGEMENSKKNVETNADSGTILRNIKLGIHTPTYRVN